MKIAVDIDNTLYDTDACSLSILKNRSREEAKLLADDTSTWFNPEFLIPEAVDALKGNHTLYVCTARQTNLSRYDQLFKDTGLRFERIIQAGDYSNKAQACLRNDIDILVDDNLENLRMHSLLFTIDPMYKTHFVLYLGHTSFDIDYVLGRTGKTNNVSIMTNWNEFNSIINERK